MLLCITLSWAALQVFLCGLENLSVISEHRGTVGRHWGTFSIGGIYLAAPLQRGWGYQPKSKCYLAAHLYQFSCIIYISPITYHISQYISWRLKPKYLALNFHLNLKTRSILWNKKKYCVSKFNSSLKQSSKLFTAINCGLTIVRNDRGSSCSF